MRDPFLDNLIGSWDLRGTMGEIELHLLDSTGVYPEPNHVVGRGGRAGDSVSFVFGDATEAFTNRLIWDAVAEAWEWELAYVEDGETRTFAKKRMVRVSR